MIGLLEVLAERVSALCPPRSLSKTQDRRSAVHRSQKQSLKCSMPLKAMPDEKIVLLDKPRGWRLCPPLQLFFRVSSLAIRKLFDFAVLNSFLRVSEGRRPNFCLCRCPMQKHIDHVRIALCVLLWCKVVILEGSGDSHWRWKRDPLLKMHRGASTLGLERAPWSKSWLS